MKVASTGPLRSPVAGRSRRASGHHGATFSVGENKDVAAGAVSGANPAVPVEAMLALQEAPDATDERSRNVARGSQLLQHLDQIRLGLLSGGIPRQTLHRLAHELRSQHSETADPKLRTILEEIELRARVELAKYGE